MCNPACLEFTQEVLTSEDVRHKRILDVGSYDVNGSVRSIVTSYEPSFYLGVDIAAGPGVDEVCDATQLLDRYGPESFDVVISTELIEHVEDWRCVMRNLKGVCRTGGCLLLTTRSLGFPLHLHPADYWRFELDDMRAILADFQIEVLKQDPSEPGVFTKARKIPGSEPADLAQVCLYSMLAERRIRTLTKQLKRLHTLAGEQTALATEVESLCLALTTKQALLTQSETQNRELALQLELAQAEVVHLRSRRAIRIADGVGKLVGVVRRSTARRA